MASHSYGLRSYGLRSYGLSSYGLSRYGFSSYGSSVGTFLEWHYGVSGCIDAWRHAQKPAGVNHGPSLGDPSSPISNCDPVRRDTGSAEAW